MLVAMHMGQPLFPGKCSHDQMGKIIEILGLPPSEMVTKAPSKQRRQFFEVIGETEENVQYRFRPLPATKRNGLIFMRWTHIDLGAQGLNGIQRPKLFFKIAGSKVLDEYYNSYLIK